MIVAAGAAIFFLSLHPNKPQGDQGVVLNDIFHQQIAKTESVNYPVNVHLQKADLVPPMAIVTSLVDGHETAFTIQVYSSQDKTGPKQALQALKK